MAGLLALGLAANAGGPAATPEAAVRAMKPSADRLLLPLALLTLASGLVLALGTPWGRPGTAGCGPSSG